MKFFGTGNAFSFLFLVICFVTSLANDVTSQSSSPPSVGTTTAVGTDPTPMAPSTGTGNDDDFFNGDPAEPVISESKNSGLPESNGNYAYALDGKTVYFKSKFNNLCINVKGGDVTGDPNLTMYTCAGGVSTIRGDNQLFMMDSTSGLLSSVLDNTKCIGLPGPSTPDGTPLQLFDCDETIERQKWYWNSNGKKLKSQWNNKRCITASNGQGQAVRATKCEANMLRQTWKQTVRASFTPQTPSGNATEATATGSDDGGVDSNEGTDYSGGGNTIFVLQSALNDLCINVRESDTNNDPALKVSKCVGNENQQWTMDPTSGDIRSEIGGNKKFCIGLPGPYSRPRTVSGTEVQLVECSSNVNEALTHNWNWTSNGRKLKSKWRTNKCLTAGESKNDIVTVTKCERGIKSQIWLRSKPPGDSTSTTETVAPTDGGPGVTLEEDSASPSTTPPDAADATFDLNFSN